jgi:hypothetical protein
VAEISNNISSYSWAKGPTTLLWTTSTHSAACVEGFLYVETSCRIVGLPALITQMDNYIYICLNYKTKSYLERSPFHTTRWVNSIQETKREKKLPYTHREEKEKGTHGRAAPSRSDCWSWTEHRDKPERFRVSVSGNKTNTRYCDRTMGVKTDRPLTSSVGPRDIKSFKIRVRLSRIVGTQETVEIATYKTRPGGQWNMFLTLIHNFWGRIYRLKNLHKS